jgi:hypothetical protein
LEKLDGRGETAERSSMQHGNRGLEIEIIELQDPQATAVRTVVELAARHQTKTPSARNEGYLQIVAEDLGTYPQWHIGPIERALKGRSVAASVGIEYPLLPRQMADAKTIFCA